MTATGHSACGKKVLIAIVAGLSAGCAPHPVEPVAAGAGARPAAWQQACVQVWSVPEANALAAARGLEGWELVAMYNGVLCFKRPLVGPPQRAMTGVGPGGYVPTVQDPGF